jgi:hypothetical protein
MFRRIRLAITSGLPVGDVPFTRPPEDLLPWSCGFIHLSGMVTVERPDLPRTVMSSAVAAGSSGGVTCRFICEWPPP